MKRVFIIHGWGGSPEEGWFPWLKKELDRRGFLVHIPNMPNPEEPEIATWVSHLKTICPNPDKNTLFVGHSIGCQTILRYLESLPKNTKIGGAIFVAGWFNLMNQSTEEQIIAKPWLETPFNFNKIRSHYTKFVAIFSDNDEIVPLTDQTEFKKYLEAKIIIEHGKGHFSGSDKVMNLPIILKEILDISNL
ncbi:MAG: alpha/beta fold hydrolase [Candidatus Woesearchaeota archaeon]